MKKRKLFTCLMLIMYPCISLFNYISYAEEKDSEYSSSVLKTTTKPFINGGTHIINKSNYLDWGVSPYYAGFSSGENEKDIDILVRGKSSPSERIYLGSKSGVLTGNIKLTIDTNDTSYYPFYHIYGGNGEIINSTHIGNSEIVINSGYAARGWLTGSGKGDKRGDSSVIVNGGQIGEENYAGQAEIYGGPAEKGSYQEGNASVVINGGLVYQHILGGSFAGATLVGNTRVQVNQGAVYGHILGGSGGGSQPNQHNGNTFVEINGGVIDPVVGSNGGNIYGGSYGPNQNIIGDTNVLINSGQGNTSYINGSVYGGSHYQFMKGAGTISGNTNVHILSGCVKDSIYGGGETSNLIDGDTNVILNNGDILGNIYGGGKSNIKGNSLLTINNGQVGKNVYGGNYSNTLDMNAYSQINGGKIGGSLYSGNYTGTLAGHAESILSGGQIDRDFIGGSSSVSGITGSSNLIIKDGNVSGDIIASSGKIVDTGQITVKDMTNDTAFLENYTKPFIALADKSTAGSTALLYDHTQATIYNSFGTLENPFTNGNLENGSTIRLAVKDKEYWAQNWNISDDSTLAFSDETIVHSNSNQSGMMTNAGKIDFTQSDRPFVKLTAEMNYTPKLESKLVMSANSSSHNEFHISGNAIGESTDIELDLVKDWDGQRIDLVFADEHSSNEAFQMAPILTENYIATLNVRTEGSKKIWYIDKKLRVYYDGNGHTSGEVPTDEEYYLTGQTPLVQHQGNIEKEGAYFNTWNTKADGSGKTYFMNDLLDPLTVNVTLYAQWIEKMYTIQYVSNKGTPVPKETVKGNEIFTEPSNPTKSGYAFGGWYVDKKLTEKYDFSTPATNDITVYAKWNKLIIPNEKKYTINYISNKGSSVSKETVKENHLFTEPLNPTRLGYKFDGWYVDKKMTEKYNFSTPATNDITVYAKWIPSLVKTQDISSPPTKQILENSYISDKHIPSARNITNKKRLPNTGEKEESILASLIGCFALFIVVDRYLKIYYKKIE